MLLTVLSSSSSCIDTPTSLSVTSLTAPLLETWNHDMWAFGMDEAEHESKGTGDEATSLGVSVNCT